MVNDQPATELARQFPKAAYQMFVPRYYPEAIVILKVWKWVKTFTALIILAADCIAKDAVLPYKKIRKL